MVAVRGRLISGRASDPEHSRATAMIGIYERVVEPFGDSDDVSAGKIVLTGPGTEIVRGRARFAIAHFCFAA